MWELLPGQLILAEPLHCAVLGSPVPKGSRITGRISEFCAIPRARGEQAALTAPCEGALMAGLGEEGLRSQEKPVEGGQALDVHFQHKNQKAPGEASPCR